MKKMYTYTQYYCDKCGKKVSKLYGSDDHKFFAHTSLKDHDSGCSIKIRYVDPDDDITDGSLCEHCLRECLEMAIEELIGTNE